MSALLVAALAAAAPVVFPQEDVVVRYGVAGADGVGQTLTVEASTGLERLDAPGGALTVVTDTRRGTALVIDRRAGTYVRERAPGGPRGTADGQPPSDAYRVTGSAVIVGLPCTEWQSRDPASGATITSCFTADGILLRTAAAGRPALVALAVHRGPVASSLFAVPEGSRDVTPPS